MLLADRTRPASPWVALAVLSTSMLMIILDGTIVSVALPALRDDLGFSATGLSWTVNAYLVPLGGLLLLAGRLGDLVGRRRMLVAGLVLFTLASLACGLATGPAMLVAARAGQGVAAALASSVVLGMVVALFPEGSDRARALGAYAFVGAAGASLGLLLGGVLTEAVGWRAIFLVNVPIGVVAVVLALRVLAPDPARVPGTRPDLLGAALVTLGLASLVFGIVETSWVAAVAAVALLGGFALRQARAAAPLVPPAVLRSRSVSFGNLAQVLTVAAMMGFQFATALFLQQVLGYSPGETGLAMLPVAAVIGVVALRFAGPVIARFTARRVLLAGLGLLLAGFAVLVGVPATDYVTQLLPALLLLGLGAGLVMPSVTSVVMSDADADTAGLTSGLANTGQQVGGAIGIAVLAAVAAASGFRAAYLVAGVLVLAAALVVALALPRERLSTP
ncbi:EmrB/QacA subfamily drug resistance transporter [Actinomycetospora succinea]|uniref:EmrB/QacA subfamily drug resistance transporter n=1 Tax=Actinomycetospora succinea TaxID=663603 RepID=A0A4R6VEQ5_9PSEU|nr:MFS transporter [Actinomycetospora succinea]TDQ61272.1 EmrB/QacA subfamily drug resistance transporter [Actinomycetospora succinea]